MNKNTTGRMKYCNAQAETFAALNASLEKAICSVGTSLRKEKLKVLEDANKLAYSLSENFREQARRITNNLIG